MPIAHPSYNFRICTPFCAAAEPNAKKTSVLVIPDTAMPTPINDIEGGPLHMVQTSNQAYYYLSISPLGRLSIVWSSVKHPTTWRDTKLGSGFPGWA